MVSPGPFFRPNSLGNWLTVTKIARPKTNPSITGRDKNAVMNPSRSSPATMKISAVKMIIPAARVA
jgi:hypothetical protein